MPSLSIFREIAMQHTVRVWDLPTRLFHWALVLSIVALIVTAKVGGNAMTWHVRLGCAVLALLAFRLVWGLVGGRWSRFWSFIYSPARTLRYLRGNEAPEDEVGHSPMGALSVFGLLTLLTLQDISGLMSDDEIATAGPLTRFVSGDTVGRATWYHANVGQYLLIALIVLHLLAILFYVLVRKRTLVRPMVLGDKQLEHPATPARDDALTRTLALIVLAFCAALAWWVDSLG